jgi:hypothetical protein
MEVVPGAGPIETIAAFGDVHLHIEWASPNPAIGRDQDRGNSGAFLMGRYEVQILDSSDGIDDIFADIVEIAANCRFSDCTHATEPGCAVQVALAAGTIDPDRLKRYEKLQREDRRNSESQAAAHARNRKFGRMAKQVFAEKLKKREW